MTSIARVRKDSGQSVRVAMADIGDIPPFDDDSCALPLSPSATITSNEDDDLSLNLFPDLIELWDNGQCSVVNHKQDSVIQNSVREIVELNDEDMDIFNTSQSFANSQNGGNAVTTSRGFLLLLLLPILCRAAFYCRIIAQF